MKKTIVIAVDCLNSDDAQIVQNFIETSCGRAKEVASANNTLKEGDLIGGRDAWLASFDGKDVEFNNKLDDKWHPFNSEAWECDDLKGDGYLFRIKPRKPVITMLDKDWSVGYSFMSKEQRAEFMAKVEKFLNEN